jgi:hypothetical protein
MSKIPTVIFNYRVEDILDEVTKRTSYTGKMRRSEQEPYLVDRLSLTRGEDFMFSEFLEEAVSETYDWVRAFGRNIPMYDKIVLNYNDVKQYKNNGYKVTISGKEIEVGKTTPIAVEKFEEQYQTNPIGNFVNVTFPEVYAEKKATNVKSTISASINSIVYYEVEDVLGNKHMEEIKRTTAIDLSSPVSSLSLPSSLLLGRTVDVELELLVTVEPQDVESIERNTYVEYHYNLDNLDMFDVYQVTVDCTTADWMDYACKQAVDPRGCVIFILERTDHMDLNLISSIDRNIKEALINYIIYKWFEYTNVEEADKFYLKFDDYGHKAQIGMNSETKIVQRKYNINH